MDHGFRRGFNAGKGHVVTPRWDAVASAHRWLLATMLWLGKCTRLSGPSTLKYNRNIAVPQSS
jgi:hypothetical protein